MMLVLEINSQYYYVDQDVRYFNTRHKIYTENESMKTISTMEIYTERLENKSYHSLSELSDDESDDSSDMSKFGRLGDAFTVRFS